MGPAAPTSVYNIAIVQSRLFGDSKGNLFNDLERVIGYPASVTIEVDKPLSALKVMSGDAVDGIKITYITDDNETINVTHGTSDTSTDPNLRKTDVPLNATERVIAISGKHGNSPFGICVTQLSFVIYDSSTGTARVTGPFR